MRIDRFERPGIHRFTHLSLYFLDDAEGPRLVIEGVNDRVHVFGKTYLKWKNENTKNSGEKFSN